MSNNTFIADVTNHTKMCAIKNYNIKSAPAFIEEKTEMCMFTNWTWLDGIGMQGTPEGNQTFMQCMLIQQPL